LYGGDILVSPVWKNGVEKQSVYLPAGEQWVDGWDTKKVYEGGKFVTVDTPLHRMPVFVRNGAEIISAFEGLEELYVKSLIIAEKKPDLKELEKTVE
jgi:alpha-glucosidase (family GH31 glycosyl hydrolase)